MKRKENTYPDNNLSPDLLCDYGPIGHFDFEDLKPEPKRILMEAIGKRKVFDTGWHGTDEGFAYMRIQSNGKSMKLSVSQAMDDWPSIVSDCPGGETLTEDEINKLEILTDAMGFTTSASISVEIGMEPFEKAMARINDMARSTDAALERHFGVLQVLVEQLINDKGGMK